MDDATVFKWLNGDGSAFRGGTGKWGLPKGDKPGAWKSVNGELVPCQNGLHLCRWQDLLSWTAPALFEAEYEGELIDHGDKIVVRKARLLRHVETWNERTARLWACDCAERALPIYEKHYPKDERPRNAIDVARRYANGEASSDELTAARDAAWAAAWAAAAARDAERTWQLGRLKAYLQGTV